MSQVAAGTSYRDTKWGRCCAIFYDEMMGPLTDTAASPADLTLSVGPDDGATNRAPPLIAFEHAGEQPRPSRRGGGRAGQTPWDRDVVLAVELWGRTPAEAEALEEQFLVALDTCAHGRAGKPGKFQPMVGSQTAGNVGAKIGGTVTIVPMYVSRPQSALPLGVARTIPQTAVSTSHGITVVAESPDGNSGEALVIE